MFAGILTAEPRYYLYFAPILLILYLVWNHYQKGLNRYPGPVLASLTDFWRISSVLSRHVERIHIDIHRKHGDVVRLGPNTLSFGTAASLKDIYGLNKGFIKSSFYPIQQGVFKGKILPSLFATQNEQYHARLRRSVNNSFSMTALIQYEHSVDKVIRKYLKQTENIYCRGVPGQAYPICDFARWLQFYAFDVIGMITYSKDHGFIDRNEDVDGMIKYMAKFFDYASVVGQLPILDRLLQKNPLLLLLNHLGIAKSTGSGAVTFAQARTAERFNTPLSTIDPKAPADLLHKFLEAKKLHPDIMNDERILTMSVSMTLAGSETTGISLGALFYYLLKNPNAYNKLLAELREAESKGLFEDPTIVSFVEANKLPYLNACVKESFRIFPAPGLCLERIVPPQGATIAGHFVPGGTIVGCTPWVIHRDTSVFGEDVDEFRPERWLDEDAGKVKLMGASLTHFGLGSRTCLGKNISLLEMYKVVPSFLRHFEVELVDKDREWRTHNAWFVRQLDFNVYIRKLC